MPVLLWCCSCQLAISTSIGKEPLQQGYFLGRVRKLQSDCPAQHTLMHKKKHSRRALDVGSSQKPADAAHFKGAVHSLL